MRSVHEPGLCWDEHGLVLRVKPSGYKQWIQRLFIHGKRRELGLGPFRLGTLAEARDTALANRKVARAGRDPRRTGRCSVTTFKQAAGQVFAIHSATWTAKHSAHWASTLRMYAQPRIGGKRLDRVTSGRGHGRAAADLVREPHDGQVGSGADRDADEMGDCAGLPGGRACSPRW